MVTFFTLPKPFLGHIGTIQRNALQSWKALGVRVLLFGNEEGVAAVARREGVEHLPDVPCNEYGIPYLKGVFEKAEELSRDPSLCYVNGDIILFPEFLPALEQVQRSFDRFLIVGECVNLDLKELLDFRSTHWTEQLRALMAERGTRRKLAADYFCFSRGLYPHFPPLVLGRPFFDNWLLFAARASGAALVDVGPCVPAVHQNHFYSAVPGETERTHKGIEAQQNLDILGSKLRVYFVPEATHRLTPRGLRRSLSGTLLLRIQQQRMQRLCRRAMSRLYCLLARAEG
jgi:hypothetical protein